MAPVEPKALQLTTPQGDMTVAALSKRMHDTRLRQPKIASTRAANFSQPIRSFEFLRLSHFFHFTRVPS